jgi:hypothetical protein
LPSCSVTFRSDMLAVLARREVRDVGKKLAQERGKPFYQPENGERISGVYRQRLRWSAASMR